MVTATGRWVKNTKPELTAPCLFYAGLNRPTTPIMAKTIITHAINNSMNVVFFMIFVSFFINKVKIFPILFPIRKLKLSGPLPNRILLFVIAFNSTSKCPI